MANSPETKIGVVPIYLLNTCLFHYYIVVQSSFLFFPQVVSILCTRRDTFPLTRPLHKMHLRKTGFRESLPKTPQTRLYPSQNSFCIYIDLITWRPGQESNPHQWNRNPLPYPLGHRDTWAEYGITVILPLYYSKKQRFTTINILKYLV